MLTLHESRRDITLAELRRELGHRDVTAAISTLHRFFYGRCCRGERLQMDYPHGRCETTTLVVRRRMQAHACTSALHEHLFI